MPKISDHSSWTDPLIGRSLGGRYRLDRVIAVGGMGAVFEAFHVSLQRPVALKVLLPTLRSSDVIVRRFHQEAVAAAKVARRGVVDVMDFDVDNEVGPFLVMENLVGEPLLNHLQRGPMEVGRSLRITLSILETLAEVHVQGIVHRDLKPANIFLHQSEEDGEVIKILDFGISRVLDEAQAKAALTAPGTVLGTLRYMPPEQARGEPVDHRADLYATALMLYCCLAGQPPYAEHTKLQLMKALQQGPPTSLRRLRAGLSEGLYAFLDRGLASRKEDRFADARSMIDALRGAAPELLGFSDRVSSNPGFAPGTASGYGSISASGLGSVSGTGSDPSMRGSLPGLHPGLSHSGISQPGLSHSGLSHSGLSQPGVSHSGISHPGGPMSAGGWSPPHGTGAVSLPPTSKGAGSGSSSGGSGWILAGGLGLLAIFLTGGAIFLYVVFGSLGENGSSGGDQAAASSQAPQPQAPQPQAPQPQAPQPQAPQPQAPQGQAPPGAQSAYQQRIDAAQAQLSAGQAEAAEQAFAAIDAEVVQAFGSLGSAAPGLRARALIGEGDARAARMQAPASGDCVTQLSGVVSNAVEPYRSARAVGAGQLLGCALWHEGLVYEREVRLCPSAIVDYRRAKLQTAASLYQTALAPQVTDCRAEAQAALTRVNGQIATLR